MLQVTASNHPGPAMFKNGNIWDAIMVPEGIQVTQNDPERVAGGSIGPLRATTVPGRLTWGVSPLHFMAPVADFWST